MAATGSRRKRRVVQVGCGAMANAWVNVVRHTAMASIVGLVDLDRGAAERLAERHGLDPGIAYDSLARAVRETGADVVFDTTVPEAHAKVSGEALRLGCDVMSEKPMTTSLAKARKLVDEAERAGRTYAVMQNRRYMAGIRSFERFLASGGIGELEEVHADFYIGAHFGGFRAQMAHPLLMDMAVHTLDQARLITGADPLSVYCHAFNPDHSWYQGDASAMAVFEMTDGLVLSYRGSWCAEGCNTSWESSWRAIGTRGSALWDGGDGMRAEVVPANAKRRFIGPVRERKIPRRSVKETGHDGCIRAFLRALQKGERPETDCSDNFRTMAMVLGAVKSAETGRKIRFDWDKPKPF